MTLVKPSGLTINEIHITPIAIVDPPLLNAAGLHAPYALRTIVELITNDNISGISEIPGNISINAVLESAGDLVIGHDPFHLNKIRYTLENHFGKESASQRGVAPWIRENLYMCIVRW